MAGKLPYVKRKHHNKVLDCIVHSIYGIKSKNRKKPIKTLIEERKTWIEIKTPSYEPPNIESAAEHVIHGIQLTGDMSEHEKSILKVNS